MAIDTARPQAAPPDGVTPPSPLKAWTITGLVVLFIVVNWADKAVLGIVAQPLQDDIGITTEQIGFIGSAFFAVFAVSNLASGWLAAKFSPKWSLIVLALAWSATQLPMLFSASVAALYISRMALGAAEGPANALGNAAAFEWFPKNKRALPAAWISAGSSIAKIAVAPVLTWIVIAFGWRAAFIALAIIGVVWSAAWLVTARTGPYAPKDDAARGDAAQDDPAKDGAAGTEAGTGEAGGADGQADTPTAASDLTLRVPYLKMVLTPTFIGGAVAASSMYGLVTVILTFLPSYLEEGLGFSRGQSGAMFGLPSVTAMIAMVGSGWLTDRVLTKGRMPRIRPLVAGGGLVVGGAMLATLPYLEGSWTALAVLVVGYGLACPAVPLMAATISQIAPAKQQAGLLGGFLALQNIGGLVAPAVTGMLVASAATAGEGYAFAFQVLGLAALAGGVLMALSVNPKRDAERNGVSW